MIDEYAASRLPDLPNAGYSTAKEKLTSDFICQWMRSVERNRPYLLSIVVDGWDKFHKVVGGIFGVNNPRGALLIDETILRRMFDYFVLQAGPNPAEQLVILHGMLKQAQVERWDHRLKTHEGLKKERATILSDLRRAQRKVRH